MEIAEIIPHIEALIFASEKPLTSMELTELINNAFGFMEEKLTLEQIQTSLEGIIEKYSTVFYPFEVRESGGGWQFLTKKEFHKTVGQLNGEKFLKRLSSAALETLAIIAYKQPITKGEIESIRGVSSDYSIQKLLEKELIIIAGRNENMPGKPLIYTTSKTFMDYFGLNSTADLPKLKEIFADTLAEPTLILHGGGEGDGPSDAESGAAEGSGFAEGFEPTDASEFIVESESVTLIVSGDGELVENEETGEETLPAEEEPEEEEMTEEEMTEEGPADEGGQSGEKDGRDKQGLDDKHEQEKGHGDGDEDEDEDEDEDAEGNSGKDSEHHEP